MLNKSDSVVIAVVVAVLGSLAALPRTEQAVGDFPVPLDAADGVFAGQLRERYGPSRNSEDLEEWIVRDFFNDERNGVFLDVGANHHQERNNTYYLETSLGWSGVAIDALPQFAE